ncbi:MAG: hypothetical protein JSS65_04395 [Armatimonadetes bacterium]|nr:hypothetical protein [Armatimonadota bacterium]
MTEKRQLILAWSIGCTTLVMLAYYFHYLHRQRHMLKDDRIRGEGVGLALGYGVSVTLLAAVIGGVIGLVLGAVLDR